MCDKLRLVGALMTGGGIHLRAESTRFTIFALGALDSGIRYERLANMAGANKLENFMPHSVVAGVRRST
jgi:hypothetical protein